MLKKVYFELRGILRAVLAYLLYVYVYFASSNLFFFYDILVPKCMFKKCILNGIFYYNWIFLILCIISEQNRKYMTEIKIKNFIKKI